MVQSAKPGLRLRVTALAETVVRKGHPWIFAGSVREENRPGGAGELAVIYDRNDKFLAVGLYDPDSPIRVRILHAGKPTPINAAWWKTRLEQVLELREGIFDNQTTGYRCINGENDGWPGLVLDRYDTTLVIKIYSAIWFPRLTEILELINERIPNERIILRLSRNIQEAAAGKFSDGQTLRGTPPTGPVIFLENGLKFEADVLQGQKTGFFLDQRENRKQVESLSSGRKVLNIFSFSGGFSVYAARGGAAEVASLDISEHALESAKRNFALNPKLRCPHELIQANAFDWLQKKVEKKYDLIILDPPSLAKRESEREEALRAYGKLIGGALERLQSGGVLVAASCSAHVSADEFFEMALATAKQSGRKCEEIMRTGHAPDHPATYKEGQYLKAIYLQF